MIGHAAGLRRLDGIIWAIVAAVAGIMLAAPLLSKFHLVGQSFLAAGGTTALFLLGYWFYETRRPDPRLSGALGSTAQLLAFAAVGAPLSYIGAIPNLSLQDQWFDVADHALGFDFFALLAWMDAHAAIHPLFWFSYFSLMPQTVIAIVALSFAGQLAWLRTFMLAFLITTLVTIAVAAIDDSSRRRREASRGSIPIEAVSSSIDQPPAGFTNGQPGSSMSIVSRRRSSSATQSATWPWSPRRTAAAAARASPTGVVVL